MSGVFALASWVTSTVDRAFPIGLPLSPLFQGRKFAKLFGEMGCFAASGFCRRLPPLACGLSSLLISLSDCHVAVWYYGNSFPWKEDGK